MIKEAVGIEEFCEAHDLSRATFYVLQKQGNAPRLMKVGRRTLISNEAAREWRERVERATAERLGRQLRIQEALR